MSDLIDAVKGLPLSVDCTGVRDFVDATSELQDINVRCMITQLMISKEKALCDGIPKSALVYIIRNDREKSLGTWTRFESSAIDIITTARPELISADGSTTYDCLVVDGRDRANITNAVDDDDQGEEEEE
jgi:hypothetical protein